MNLCHGINTSICVDFLSRQSQDDEIGVVLTFSYDTGI